MTKETQRAKELESKIVEMSNKITAMETLKSEPKIEEAKEEVSVDLSEIIKDFPEIVKPLQKYVDARFAQMDQKVSATTQEVLAARKEEEDKKHFDAIASAHPDYATVSNSPDFRIWLERQTKMWKEVAVDGETQDVISLLSKYKKDLGIDSNTVSKEDLVEKAKQNVEPTLSKARKQNIGSSKKIWSRSEIDKLSDKQYKKFEKDIDKAYTEGRIKP
jgi:phage shock protein A